MWSESSVRDNLGKKTKPGLANVQGQLRTDPVLFDADGREVIRADGFFHRFHIQSIIDYENESVPSFTSFQRYISERAEAFQEKGIDVDL